MFRKIKLFFKNLFSKKVEKKYSGTSTHYEDFMKLYKAGVDSYRLADGSSTLGQVLITDGYSTNQPSKRIRKNKNSDRGPITVPNSDYYNFNEAIPNITIDNTIVDDLSSTIKDANPISDFNNDLMNGGQFGGGGASSNWDSSSLFNHNTTSGFINTNNYSDYSSNHTSNFGTYDNNHDTLSSWTSNDTTSSYDSSSTGSWD